MIGKSRLSCFPLKFRNFFDIGYNFVENCLFLNISGAPYCFAQLFRMHYLINAALFLHEILTYYRVRRPLQVEFKNYVKKYLCIIAAKRKNFCINGFCPNTKTSIFFTIYISLESKNCGESKTFYRLKIGPSVQK